MAENALNWALSIVLTIILLTPVLIFPICQSLLNLNFGSSTGFKKLEISVKMIVVNISGIGY